MPDTLSVKDTGDLARRPADHVMIIAGKDFDAPRKGAIPFVKSGRLQVDASITASGAGAFDLLYTDDSGTQFIYRDNGATPPVFTAYKMSDGSAYTVGANPRPYEITGYATAAAQGATTDVPVADNTTLASATAATGIGLFKRLVNLGITILAKIPTFGASTSAIDETVINETVTIAAGKHFVQLIFSADFTGTVNGATRDGTVDDPDEFTAPAFMTLPAIPIVVTTGSIEPVIF